jgi:hypothetical protein
VERQEDSQKLTTFLLKEQTTYDRQGPVQRSWSRFQEQNPSRFCPAQQRHF